MEKRTSRKSKAALALKGAFLLVGISLFARPVPNPTLHTNYVQRVAHTNAAPVATMLPQAMTIAPRLVTTVYYFAATAYTTNAESIYSNQISYTNTSTNSPTVTLAWDPSPSPGVIGYRVYEGVIPYQYPYIYDAGPNTLITIDANPAHYTLKHYVKVTWRGGGSDIWYAQAIGNLWMKAYYATNSFMLTNPPGQQIFWMATNIVITNWFAP